MNIGSIMIQKTARNTNFNVGDSVVYPSHGVGVITSEEVQSVAGTEVNLYVISFEKDKMILRVPKSRASKAGLRHLSSDDEIEAVVKILQSKAKLTKGMWSKRAQEYEMKINSGSIVAIAEVLRDLHRNVEDPERSYSEKVIYDLALDRLVNEYSVATKLDRAESHNKILSILNYTR